ncbi:hypothetical protein LX97_03385 [Nonlabens dokdonensis]|uniref:Uncharacterized protein n=2 Tax=Nonlabens dokdonensis TaxID=328515 RepID=L7WDD0_NONDD|nr:hypothetical protein DDD_2814 [Nonlabens dokdonensis DSW-6]PZX36628.1 hypothetical protein LX97_03385 [Nonlabens dokdonensis]
MKRRVEKDAIVSDYTQAEFFNFSYYLFFLISQIKKFDGLANMA